MHVFVDQRVGFILSGGDHTISIGFDPANEEYVIINPTTESESPIAKKVETVNELAIEIVRAFSSNDIPTEMVSPIILSIEAYASTNDPDVRKNILNAFDQRNISPEKQYSLPLKAVGRPGEMNNFRDQRSD